NLLLTRLARLMLARRLVRAGGKVLVAATAAPAMGDDNALVGLRKIVDFLTSLVVIHNGSDRNLEDDAFAVTAGAFGASAVASGFRVVFRIEAEMDRGVVALARSQAPVAPAPAVASGRPAAGNEFFAAKGHAAIAAVAGFDADDGLV